MLKILQISPCMSLTSNITNFLNSSTFNNFVFFVIVVHCICLGLDTYSVIHDKLSEIFNILNIISSTIYLVEITLKTIFIRTKYLKNPWNLFDIVIVLVPLLSMIPGLYALRFLRILRILRSARLVSHTKPLQLILIAIVKSLSKLAWTGILLLLIFYIYAVLGASLFGTEFHAWFGDIGKSAYSLFQIMTLESWSMGIARPVIAVFPFAWIYFISFVIISSFIIMNLVVAIIVQTISDESNKLNNSEQSQLQQANSDSDSHETHDEIMAKELDAIRLHLQNIERIMAENRNHTEVLDKEQKTSPPVKHT